MHRSARVVSVAFVSLLAATFVSTSDASAAAPWNYRGLTLPRHDIAVDFGMGYGHEPVGPDGLGHEPGAARRRRARLRARLPHGVPPGRRRPDHAGRLLRAPVRHRDVRDASSTASRTRSYASAGRWRAATRRSWASSCAPTCRSRPASRFGFMFGLPIALRAGPIRFDTGLYVPIIFYDPTQTDRQHPAPHLDPGRRATSGWARSSGCAS